MQIDWNILSDTDSSFLSRMKEAADQCTAAEKIDIPCMISVCLCDDHYIRTINRQYRNLDRSTDVLSFPSVTYPAGMTAGTCESLIRQEYDPETGACFLGDIFISVQHIKTQAVEYGHSELREAVYLLVHGICHLMGYDHIQPDDKEKMRHMEEKIMSAVNIHRDQYDTDDETLLNLARQAMSRSY